MWNPYLFLPLINMVEIYPSCRWKASNFRKSMVRQRCKVPRKMATIFFARSERKDAILRGVVTFPLQLKQLVWRWAKNGWKILVGTRRSTFSFLSVVPQPLYTPREALLSLGDARPEQREEHAGVLYFQLPRRRFWDVRIACLGEGRAPSETKGPDGRGEGGGPTIFLV